MESPAPVVVTMEMDMIDVIVAPLCRSEVSTDVFDAPDSEARPQFDGGGKAAGLHAGPPAGFFYGDDCRNRRYRLWVADNLSEA